MREIGAYEAKTHFASILDAVAGGETVLLTLARRHAITACDALYLELAIRHAAPIATLDKRLAKAARDAGMAVIGRGP